MIFNFWDCYNVVIFVLICYFNVSVSLLGFGVHHYHIDLSLYAMEDNNPLLILSYERNPIYHLNDDVECLSQWALSKSSSLHISFAEGWGDREYE